MLEYSKFNGDPFPDKRDPVTGEYIPMSQVDIKSANRAKQSEAQTRSLMSNLLSLVK